MFKRAAALVVWVSALSMGLAASAASLWSPDLRTQEGRLALIKSVLGRHPRFLAKNLAYRHSPLHTLIQASQVLEMLGESGASARTLSETPRWSATFASEGSLNYDPAKVQALKSELIKEAGKLELSNPRGLESDLRGVPEAQLRRYFHLLPLLYAADGSLRHPGQSSDDLSGALVRAIIQASPSELDLLYNDAFKNHLRARARNAIQSQGLKQAGQVLASVENQFLQKTVQPALALKSDHQKSIRSLTFEEVPPLVALMRGNFGGDCSMLSVPHYVLAPGVRTYWIRKGTSLETQPDGYVVVAPVTYKGKTYPYILSMNGPSLGSSDAEQIVRMVARAWKTDRVILPDLETNPYLVNTAPLRAGMTVAGSQEVEVEFAEAWHAVSRFTDHHQIKGYQNYYDPSKISRARLADVSSGGSQEIQELQPALSYPPLASPSSIRLLDRALLAAQLILDQRDFSEQGDREHQAALDSLEVTREQRNAALPILEGETLNAHNVRQARDLLDFDSSDLMTLDLSTRSRALGRVHREDPTLFAEKVWLDMTQRTSQALRKELANYPDEARVREWVYSLLLALPRIEGFDSLWDRVFAELDRDDKANTIEPELLKKAVDSIPWPAGLMERLDSALKAIENEEFTVFLHGSVERAIEKHKEWTPGAWIAIGRSLGADTGFPVRAKLAIIKGVASQRESMPESFAAAIPGLLRESEGEVKAAILRKWMPSGTWSQEIWELVALALSDRDPAVRVAAVSAIYHRTDWPSAIQAKVPEMLRDTETDGRVASQSVSEVIATRLTQPRGAKPKGYWKIADRLMADSIQDPKIEFLSFLESNPEWPAYIWRRLSAWVRSRPLLSKALVEILKTQPAWPEHLWIALAEPLKTEPAPGEYREMGSQEELLAHLVIAQRLPPRGRAWDRFRSALERTLAQSAYPGSYRNRQIESYLKRMDKAEADLACPGQFEER